MIEKNKRRILANESRKMFGCVCQLRSLENKPLTVEKIRDLVNQIYNDCDNFLILLEKLEK